LIILIGLIIPPNGIYAYTPIANSPLAKNEHPRIFITTSTLPIIASKAKTSHLSMYTTIKSRADELLVTAPIFGSYSYNVFNTIAVLALVAMIEKQNSNPYAVYRDRAFLYANYIIDNTDPWDLTSIYTGQSYNIMGRCAALNFVYDWLHTDLNETLKTDIHNFLVNVYKGLHNIDRPSGAGQVRKSCYGSNYWLEWGSHVWFSTVLFGDGMGDENIIEEALDATTNESHNYMASVLNILGGAMHNGWGYQLYDGDMSYSVLNLLAWQTASSEVIFSEAFAFKDYPKYWLYARKPDNTLIKLNDTCADIYCVYPNAVDKYTQPRARATLLPLLSVYKDGYVKYIVDLGNFRGASNRMWRDLLFYDEAVISKNPTTLDLVKFFPGTGIVFGRSGWGPDDLFFTFRNRDQYGNHSDCKQNSFTIFYKGNLLAINDGNYPPGASGHPHTKNYYRRTISSNSILVFDPNETFSQYGASLYNDGGQKYGGIAGTGGYDDTGAFNNTYYTQASHDASIYNTAHNIFENSDYYTWIKGDATRGYNDAKVAHFEREFIYLKSEYFVIFDRVTSTNKDFKKKWLLHSITKPILNGTEYFSCSETKGEAVCCGDQNAGISKSFDSDLVNITNGNGRLFVKVLLPDSPIIRKVGGTGFEFWVDDGNQNIPPKSYNSSVTGGWRVEISPTIPTNNDLFLNVLYLTDSSKTSIPQIEKLNALANNMLGAIIKDPIENKIVLFSANASGAIVNNEINYSVTTNKKSRHFLYGLQPNSFYSVAISPGNNFAVKSSDKGTVMFMDPLEGAHSYAIKISILGTIPAPPTNIELAKNMNAVILTWEKSIDDGAGDNDITYYNIYRSVTTIDGNYKSIAQVIAGNTNYTDTNTNVINYYKIASLDKAGEKSAILYQTGLKAQFSTTKPGPVNELTSPSHNINTPSENSIIEVIWETPTIIGTGIYGYSISWDTNPTTIPDTIKDIEAINSTISPGLSNDDDHYFHIRAVDYTLNWSDDIVHIGPFYINDNLQDAQRIWR